ncbi:hypothetical protein FB451DRAFT_1337652 [Mycena latifolia]|nr:hypothetical protein FB451DRAFT_1337652 [Mycena latifolia]
MSPEDKSTWHTERIKCRRATLFSSQNSHRKHLALSVSLFGGEDRISEETKMWKDNFTVNLGKEGQGQVAFRDLKGWHVDGDSFLPFLDSPEQALLVMPIFSDIAPGGGTVICTDGIRAVVKYLYDNPNGVTPWMHVRGTPEPQPRSSNPELTSDASFHEMTGEVGDVYLLHPLMVHSTSKNATRIPRVITNPPVSLKAPFRFDTTLGKDFSLVEQKTLREKIEGDREVIVSRRVKIQEEMKEQGLQKLARDGTGNLTVMA